MPILSRHSGHAVFPDEQDISRLVDAMMPATSSSAKGSTDPACEGRKGGLRGARGDILVPSL